MPDSSESSPGNGSIAVAAPPEEDLEEKTAEGATKPKREPPYHVIIWNDETHTYEYVIELLMKLFAHSYLTALEITTAVDKQGKGVAFTTHKELAELKRDQVLAYGPDWRMSNSNGSIRSTIEPAPE